MKEMNKNQETGSFGNIIEELQTVGAVPIRDYKDRVFRMLFKEKEKALELYNAMNGTEYTDSENLVVTTLENALYLGMKNDVSFVLYDQLLLYEHQSTKNPNMPLRDLMYVTCVYSRLVENQNLYSSTLIKIPEPKFIVFYNGTNPMPETQELRLSDAYEHSSENPALELKTLVLNINQGCNEELKGRSRTLYEYMIFVDTVRRCAKNKAFPEAMKEAIDECIRYGVLRDFLKKNRAEVQRVAIFEYNEEKHMEQERSEAEKRGEERGIQEGIQEGLQKKTISVVGNLLKKGIPDAEIREIAECSQDMIIEVRKTL